MPVGEAFVPGTPARRHRPANGTAFEEATGCGSSACSNRGWTSRPAPRRPGARRARFSASTGPAATISAAKPCSRGAATAWSAPQIRYGTLGGFLAGQALSNFSDADADTDSMEFGGAIGSTGGQRIPQVRYTLAGPYGSAFSVSAENPFTDDDPSRAARVRTK